MPLWQQAGIAAGVLLALALVVRVAARLSEPRVSEPRASGGGASGVGRRRVRRVLGFVGAASQEAGTILGLFTLWQIARILGVTRVGGAMERADWIWRTERMLRLPSELAMERFMLHHESWLRAANVFYSWVHFPAMNVFLVWLFLRHRRAYPSVRTTIVLFTGSSLLFHMFLPTAPPRMLTSVGFVDEAVALGQSVYGEFGAGVAAQLSALPSVHVGWACLIAYEVIRISPSRWRWLILAHPIVTSLVVVVTANHWWADGILAGALLALAIVVGRALSALRRRLLARSPWGRVARPGVVVAGSAARRPVTPRRDIGAASAWSGDPAVPAGIGVGGAGPVRDGHQDQDSRQEHAG
ncbi:phosphatase PAP2 family protein [Frankia sp. Ag45/Mut15]|uniref:Phosphatase PAP2 family protein n=1 Tax=Frankia umida TaxID=573489 RepID=A0ABT0K5T6_9ACTN|nr:phosphatase PAP2 family protein [Frankia umida]MCK9878877.1 phosphatase PAP2 family protein [Frankia umida]